MPETHQETLIRYLQSARDALLWKLEGLSEYDVRRPMTPSATNLLGLVKHLAGIELGYLGECVGRPSPVQVPVVLSSTSKVQVMVALSGPR